MMNLTPSESTAGPSLRDIEISVCTYFGIDRKRLSTRDRGRDIAWPRFMIVHLARERTTLSTTQLGNAYHRDHTTILNAERRAKELLQVDTKFRLNLQAVETLLACIEPFKETVRASVARGLVGHTPPAPAQRKIDVPPSSSIAAPTQVSLFEARA